MHKRLEKPETRHNLTIQPNKLCIQMPSIFLLDIYSKQDAVNIWSCHFSPSLRWQSAASHLLSEKNKKCPNDFAMSMIHNKLWHICCIIPVALLFCKHTKSYSILQSLLSESPVRFLLFSRAWYATSDILWDINFFIVASGPSFVVFII